MIKTVFVLLMAVAIGVLAGCGGGSSEGTTSSGSSGEAGALTKSEFVKKADAVCDATNKKRQAMVNNGEGEIVSNTVGALREDFDGIGQLDPPQGEEEEIEEILHTVRKTVQFLETKPLKVKLAERELFKAEKLVEEYGLKACLLPSA